MRSDEYVLGVEAGDNVADVVGEPVAEVVVGHDTFDAGDAVIGEVDRCAAQERSAGRAFIATTGIK